MAISVCIGAPGDLMFLWDMVVQLSDNGPCRGKGVVVTCMVNLSLGLQWRMGKIAKKRGTFRCASYAVSSRFTAQIGS